MAALACADPDLIEGATALFKGQVRDNLLAGGESIDFAERDAIHYVVYSVEPLLEAALFSSLCSPACMTGRCSRMSARKGSPSPACWNGSRLTPAVS